MSLSSNLSDSAPDNQSSGDGVSDNPSSDNPSSSDRDARSKIQIIADSMINYIESEKMVGGLHKNSQFLLFEACNKYEKPEDLGEYLNKHPTLFAEILRILYHNGKYEKTNKDFLKESLKYVKWDDIKTYILYTSYKFFNIGNVKTYDNFPLIFS